MQTHLASWLPFGDLTSAAWQPFFFLVEAGMLPWTRPAAPAVQNEHGICDQHRYSCGSPLACGLPMRC